MQQKEEARNRLLLIEKIKRRNLTLDDPETEQKLSSSIF